MNRLCSVTVDLRDTEAYEKQFGTDVIDNITSMNVDYMTQDRPDVDTVAADLRGHVQEGDEDDVATIVVDDTTGDEARDQVLRERYTHLDDLMNLVYDTAAQWAWERALVPDDDDLALSLDDALEACQGAEMYGVLTEVYWCGVLCAWPWGEITSDEEGVVDDVLSRAKVKGATFTLSYAGTKYARQLLAIRRRDEDEHRDDRGDWTLGGNLAMELGTMARYVVDAAITRAAQRISSRFDTWGPTVKREDIQQLMGEFFR